MLLRLIIIFIVCTQTVIAADLLEVYQQAQLNDAIFQQAIAQRLATKEGVPISASALLPNVTGTANPSIARYGYSGTSLQEVVSPSGDTIYPRNLTQRTYTLNLAITQTIFNFAQFSQVAQQVALSHAADAILNAALQDLMTRVATAYFNVLRDEDNLGYSEIAKLAYKEQLDQMQKQYKVGLKTRTDVATAAASYESARAQYIAAQATLENDKENLRVITGTYYDHLDGLNKAVPLVSPKPEDVNRWVQVSLKQNWSIKAAQYNVTSAKEIVQQQIAGHLPTLYAEADLQRQYQHTISLYPTFVERNGPGTTTERAFTLNLSVPIFSGGGVSAQVRQAKYNYEAARQQLEQTMRETTNTARQSYQNVLAGISRIKADLMAVKANQISLKGLQASYGAGLETLVDVLNQQQKLFQAQTQYAADKYAYINNLLALKKAAGTLSFDDLQVINSWLMAPNKN